MPVFPYKLRPAPPALAVLRADGESVLCEDGAVRTFDALPAGYRVWGSWERVSELWGDGLGEALCWEARPVRWRPQARPDEKSWINRPTDVRVLRIAWPEEDDDTALAGLLAWRTWLAGYGASPQGSLGSTSWSLLRATLRAPLWTNRGSSPPVPYVLGGRQELVSWIGRYEPARHYDLPAAYAAQLGAMRYGGHWAQVGKSYPYQAAARRRVLC